MFKVNGSATKCMNQCKYGRLLLSCNLNLKWPQKFAFLIEWHKKIQLLFNKKFYLSLMLSDPTQIPFSSQMLNKMWTIYDFRIDVWNQIDLCLNLKYEFSCISHCIVTTVWWMDFYKVQSFCVMFMSWSAIICSVGKTIHSIWSCWRIMISSQLIL